MITRRRSLSRIAGPSILFASAFLFVPVGLLKGYWIGGEEVFTLLALACPVLWGLVRVLNGDRLVKSLDQDDATGLMLRSAFQSAVHDRFKNGRSARLTTACFLVQVQSDTDLLGRFGQATADQIARSLGGRLLGVLRPDDAVTRIGEGRFAICLHPSARLNADLAHHLASRLHGVLEDPVHVNGYTLPMSCAIGFCLDHWAPAPTATSCFQAAELALNAARAAGPSCIRAYTADIQRQSEFERALQHDVKGALENRAIHAWFQPQLSTDTGRVTSFEALARWHHPTHGLITPDIFLPLIEEQNLMSRLTQVILRDALRALREWDCAGHDVPRVAINLSEHDLADPALATMIARELDRVELSSDRLCVEILETVVSGAPNDVVLKNAMKLHDMGCAVDLDDYGTGNASLTAIKRFPIDRIKIDRSFVSRSDSDPSQQRLIAALISMAEQLDLETLAEGVETAGEHALLAQLGCSHVQGFGIARPMPFSATLEWMTAHSKKMAPVHYIGRTGPSD